MAGVTIDSGVPASALLENVPESRWKSLVYERMAFVRDDFPKDCRCLVRFVEEAKRMWKKLGYASADDLVRRGYGLDDDDIDLVTDWLKKNDPKHPVGLPEVRSKVQALAANAEPLNNGAGRPKKGDEKSLSDNDSSPRRQGTSSEYLAARIARDRPDVLKRMKAGEFKSVRAAAIEAGIVTPVAPLDAAKRAFKKLSAADRKAFLAFLKAGGAL